MRLIIQNVYGLIKGGDLIINHNTFPIQLYDPIRDIIEKKIFKT